MSTPIIIDCDPGHDDAFALLLALASPEVDVRAVTTVGGNQVVDRATRNALLMAAEARRPDVPVSEGSAAPLFRELVVGDDVHGETGLDGWEFDEPTLRADPREAVDLMADVLEATTEPVTIVALGPQTNLARLLMGRPRAREAIRRIVCMGGSTGRGNSIPYAEYNVYTDPDAAQLVLTSGVEVDYCGLTLTFQAPVTPERLEDLSRVPYFGPMFTGFLEFRSRRYSHLWGLRDAPLHDAVAMASVVDPEVVTERLPAHVAVERLGDVTRGATSVAFTPTVLGAANATVQTALDAERFWELTLRRLGELGSSRREGTDAA